MEIQIKKTIKAGNSSAVLLPRSWLNKEVRVELKKKTSETILLETLGIIKKEIKLNEVIGIYLTGSYARGEEDENSDIDILVITKNIDKEMINEGIYNILIISSVLLKQKLKNDLFPIGQMLKEAKSLLNSDYLDSIKIEVTKKNIEWYIATTEDKLEIILEVLKRAKSKDKQYVSDIVGYTLVLRIRTLYIIEKLIKNKDYFKKEFIRLIKKISNGINAYERYLIVKNDSKEENKLNIKEAERLYEYLKKQLEIVKGLVKKTNKKSCRK